ncbi:aminodeoxychorismate synthase component I [Nocardiopsis dassonvillei]|uniref:aminodeoxychorismate synthase component I n=1 Tax=Nocardiopsis dassonvillei TaxID=2014 RepID=UPI00102C39CD|nr:aminodeoxychorismate synthase component I [Nocardiopsis dassonvillei]MCP3012111.1 aminodeoxychorismate synthase component I [Nocardiopsis dassonvillei]
MHTLLIDNYDSYTYNLFQLIAATTGVEPEVCRNDDPRLLGPGPDTDAVVVSPGPGRPDRPSDLGHAAAFLSRTRAPVLGVCLGHQALGWLAGSPVVPSPRPRHGAVERVLHNGRNLFTGLPQGFPAVRYHSLCLPDGVKEHLDVDARTEDGVVMGVSDPRRAWWGVQFHPESVATEHGARLLGNFFSLARPTARGGSALGKGRTADSAVRRAPSPAPRPRTPWLLRWRRLERAPEAEYLFRLLFADLPYAYWLDSSRPVEGFSRFSFLGAPSGPDAEVLTYDAGAGRLRVGDGEGAPRRTEEGSVFDLLEARLSAARAPSPRELPFDFNGGYVGYMGYEAKADCGSPNRHTARTPDALWMSATRTVAVDHRDGATWLLASCRDLPASVEAADQWLDSVQALAGGGVRRSRSAPAAPDPVEPTPFLRRRRAGYVADVHSCLEELRAGESYEICLTNEVSLPCSGDPLETYLRMRRANPAPYGAFLRAGPASVLCSSPERFLRVGEDGTAESKPMKGTAPRHPDPAADARLRASLARDPKTRAENLMIVDLVRNDLGRVCEVGGVSVPRYMQVESYTSVHQLVSTVEGRLRPGVGAVGAARACFPGGSMTGAPKLRTMEIIERLEGRARGVYSGSLGYFALSGAADLNIVIRTAVVADGRMTVGAGGAIVLDSDPEAEFQEMVLKARAGLCGTRADETGPAGSDPGPSPRPSRASRDTAR